MGLANRVVPKGEARQRAEELAAELAELPQQCMRADRLSMLNQWGHGRSRGDGLRVRQHVSRGRRITGGRSAFRRGRRQARGERLGSALADLVVRAGVVDLRVAVFVGDGVVQADDADLLVDLFEVDLVVRAADVDVGARALDGQSVVRPADVERLSVRAVDVGGGAERPVVDGVADFDLSAGRARRRGRRTGCRSFRSRNRRGSEDGGRRAPRWRTCAQLTRVPGRCGWSYPARVRGPRWRAHRSCRRRSGPSRTP